MECLPLLHVSSLHLLIILSVSVRFESHPLFVSILAINRVVLVGVMYIVWLFSC